MVTFSGPVTLLESVLELATIVTEYVAPTVRPNMVVLVSLAAAVAVTS